MRREPARSTWRLLRSHVLTLLAILIPVIVIMVVGIYKGSMQLAVGSAVILGADCGIVISVVSFAYISFASDDWI